ncbi:DUF418 domain-containing protein [Chitinophaga sp. 212800010-3]|uniref:DUF418 domain-containing protein n=1 Tax=unclassified Chitinophaga TaxID=2619133 RepID=UPI002DEC86C3|nr:DUF418 domain-containing protein [Chitinophaga sp. 212800010-3]
MQLVAPVPAPMVQAGRIHELDAIRGVALAGILLVNMGLFSFPALYLDPLEYWPGTWNKISVLFVNLVGEGKFISMFSFLFGLGFTIFLQSAEKKGHSPVKLFLRRLLVLLGIGMIHANFIWFGDVLCFYSTLGALLLFFRHCKPETLVKWAMGLLLIPVLLYMLGGMIVGSAWFADGGATTTAGTAAIDAYRNGTWQQLYAQNANDLIVTRIGYLIEAPVIFAMFLLGAYAGKRRIFHDPEQHIVFIRRVQLGSAMIGWPIALLSLLYISAGHSTAVYSYAQVFSSYIAGPAIGIFYIATIIRLLRCTTWQRILLPFQAAGRMAATNYLLQSVICVSVYYSFGGGLYAGIGPLAILWIWATIFVVQLAVSSWWMSHFRFGPVEWLWRSLTYGKMI